MTAIEVIEQLKQMSNADRQKVIDAASQMVRQETASDEPTSIDDDPILRVAGILSFDPVSSRDIDNELYGPAGEA